MDKRVNVLIVDDERWWTDYCSRKIRIDNINLEVSNDVEDALEKVEFDKYDFIFCDYKMAYNDIKGLSHSDGGKLIGTKAKSRSRKVKAIMITAYGSEDLAAELLHEGGFDFYIAKDSNPQTTIHKIIKYLGKALESWSENPIATNPFVALRGKAPKYWVPRYACDKGEIEFFREQMRVAEGGYQARFLLSGQPGAGKSCLLQRYKELAQKRGHCTSLFELPGTPNSYTFGQAVVSLLFHLNSGFPEPGLIKKFLRSVSKLGAKVKFLGAEIHIDWGRQDFPPDALLSRELQAMIDYLKRRSEVVVMLFDNIPNDLSPNAAIKSLLDTLGRQSFQEQPIILGGSVAPEQSARVEGPRIDSYLARVFAGSIFHLDNFSKQDAHELAYHTLARTGVTFEGGLIESVHKYTGGHPYATQLLYRQLYDCQMSGIVKKEAFKMALKNSMMELYAFLKDVPSALTEHEEVILQLVAFEEDGAGLNQLRRRLLDRNIHFLRGVTEEICSKLEGNGILLKNSLGKYRPALLQGRCRA
jgi:CheY-like chemotaxis protein